MQNMNNKKLVSIVIPCVNEEKNIDRTIVAIIETFKTLDYDYEIIPVNDGSKDNTWGVIKELTEKHPHIIGIDQMTNFGQSAAYQAGFDEAKGDYVLIVSADLETPIEYLRKVLEYLENGYDFVNTNRTGRWGEGSDRAAKSGMANRIIKKISGVEMKDRGSGMKGFTRMLAKNLRFYGEMHRFIPDYVSVYGAKMVEFDTPFNDREHGQSYYKGHKRTIKVLLDLLTLQFMLYFAKKPFTMMPGRLFGFTGFVITGLGGLIGVYLTILKIFGQSIGSRPLFIAAVLMIIVGIQSMMMGMLGELLLRVYFESTGRKTYVVRRTTR